jgi:osmoprotectant transport system ATP-binding protein
VFALEAVTHHYGPVTALDGVSVNFPEGSVTAIVGSSGCGKSTLLRLLLGLERSSRGRILYHGEPVNEGSWRRVRHASGYVIQGGGLFPHLRGEANLALLPRHLGWSRAQLHERTEALCQTLGFDPLLLPRYPQELSGGQRQRLALLRALMIDPPALLLDEPLSALDPISRHQLQDELHRLIGRLRKTVLLVTHDLAEAAFLAPRLVLMQAGRIVQEGSFEGLRDAPANAFVSDFVAAQRALPA